MCQDLPKQMKNSFLRWGNETWGLWEDPETKQYPLSVEVNHFHAPPQKKARQSLRVTRLLKCAEHAYSLSTFMKLCIMNMFHKVNLNTNWHHMACDEKKEAKIIWKMALGIWFLYHNMHLSILLSLSTNFCLKQNECHSTPTLLTRFSAILTSSSPKTEDGVKGKKM